MILALANEWDRESERLDRKVQREYPNAGHSNDSKGTGDEGWMQVYEDAGRSRGLAHAAARLRAKLRYMETSPLLNHMRKNKR